MRYRLRTLLICVTSLCIGPGGYIAYQQSLARNQQAAVRRIEQLGGTVTRSSRHSPSRRGRWLSLILGDDSSSSVTRVWLNDTAVSDADLACVARLRNLETLDLGWTPITDAGLAHLHGLEHLEELSLDGTKVTDKGLVHLQSLQSLRKIWLEETRTTNVGRTQLQRVLPDAHIGWAVAYHDDGVFPDP
jgi:hypothetical protein